MPADACARERRGTPPSELGTDEKSRRPRVARIIRPFFKQVRVTRAILHGECIPEMVVVRADSA